MLTLKSVEDCTKDMRYPLRLIIYKKREHLLRAGFTLSLIKKGYRLFRVNPLEI
jgi:hypothetical protein